MTPREPLVESLGAWLDAPSRDPSALLRAHPEHAGALREHMEALESLARALQPPESCLRTLGGFRVLREIGRGAMGIVYEAEQVSMRRRVALKILHPSVAPDSRAVERFRREARIAGRLQHTNIVPVYWIGRSGGVWYYAMELVVGRPLGDAIASLRRAQSRSRRPALAPGEAVAGLSARKREGYRRIARAFAGVADALGAAHANGVVHRDVKPSNVMIGADGTIKVVDFGLARWSEASHAATRTGDLLGTPAYMSPEQARGVAIDGRSDVYSLGATLYEALTLQPLFEGRSVPEILRRVIAEEPPPPRRVEPSTPRDLETIVLKATAKDPSRRYATADDLASDLRRFAQGLPIHARRSGFAVRLWRRARRYPARTALVATARIATAGGAVLLDHARRESDARRHLEYERIVHAAASSHLPVLDSLDDLRLLHGPHAVAVPVAEYSRAIEIAPERPEAYPGTSSGSSRVCRGSPPGP